MISSVSVKVGKKTHKLKVSMAAQERLEIERCQPIGDIVEALIDGSGGVRLVISAWAAFLDDGKGVEREEAIQVLDALGGANAASPHFAKALQNAFPVLDTDKATDTVAEAAADQDKVGNGTSPVK